MSTFSILTTQRAALLAVLTVPLIASGFSRPTEPRHADELVPFAQSPTALAAILARFGPPPQRVGADLWVYWNAPNTFAAARQAGYDTLVVHTEGDFARSVRLVRSADLRALLRQIGRNNQVPGSRRRQ